MGTASRSWRHSRTNDPNSEVRLPTVSSPFVRAGGTSTNFASLSIVRENSWQASEPLSHECADSSKGLEASGATRVRNGDSPWQGPSWSRVGDSSGVAQDATRRVLVGQTGSTTAAVSGVPRPWRQCHSHEREKPAALHRRLRLGGHALLGPVYGVPGRRK
ncbi:uncharacterized protein BDZ99DRAFT_200093 [Mytilinidion resinicola]|uniref:Uncharacterized protein n=1 Tax=Mytilinidion resinicola TaxID=574789 RepID=A0A6A6Y2C8_9PEZI|nr:uncharacterized protein BDZ99DRAFT_200093 [Mytilinidion resinicola]KAF2802810.1 hypothetical protein BDZ99DRAFT_200093 [Mytilinidion resinicola]